MALQSMTGFSRSEGETGRLRWTWELRSVNGKGLDLRLRLPQGLERLEAEVRRRIQARFSRGNIQATLSAASSQDTLVPVLNEEALAAVLKAAERVMARAEVAPASVDGLLNIRGVLDMREPGETEEEQTERDAAILAGLEKALSALAEMRGQEGEALKSVLEGHLEAIEDLVSGIDADRSRSPAAIRERLAQQVALLADAGSLDSERLHLEAVLLAAKADLREELDRLHAHVAAGRELLKKGGPVGRRLDFLAQEFNRESNTICSKSNAASVTARGMELKVIVDQLREQVQNLE